MTPSKISIITISIKGVKAKEIGLKKGFIRKAEENSHRKISKKRVPHRNGLHLKLIGKSLSEGSKNGKSNFIKLTENNQRIRNQLQKGKELSRKRNF